MIAKRGNRWRVVVQAGRDPLTGQRRQLSGSAAGKAEALRLERALFAQAAERVVPRIVLRKVVAEWWQSGPRLAPSTRANYRTNLDRHILPLLGNRQVAEVRPRLVASFLVHFAEKGLAPGTVRKVRTVLSAVMSYAVAMEYVESNPVMKVPPPELDAEERVAPTLEETATLMLAAEVHDPDFLTYLWVSAEEGGRRGETLALSSTTRRFRRLKELAGVRNEVDLHGLRHTMITELLAAGVDPRTVMGRAGHTSETMTMEVYAKVRPSRDTEAAELWGTMLRSKLTDQDERGSGGLSTSPSSSRARHARGVR